MSDEGALLFDCDGEQLCGVLHSPDRPTSTGLLLVVGGPQYRVGSHRQFVLLARALCAAGIPVFRFDYRGMGDSSGDARDFERIGDDIAAASSSFFEHQSGLSRIVLWGLCDAATASAFYAASTLDGRIIGQVAVNPWVRTTEGEAEAFIRHYYLQRLLSREFWRKLLALNLDVRGALKDFVGKLLQSRRQPRLAEEGDLRPLPERLFTAQTGYPGETLVILSGQDLTAREYEARVAERPNWQAWLASDEVTLRRLAEADHTFSRAAWRDQVAEWTRDWLLELHRRAAAD
jgi:exosortase A-associated hydrolase 1